MGAVQGDKAVDPLAFEVLDPQKMLGTDLPIWSPALEEAEFQQQLLRDLR